MIAVEVGAHDGKDTKEYLERYERVYAFEPAPNMLKKLQEIDDPRLTVIPKAVANFDGSAIFYLDELGDQGCGSLYPFVPGIEKRWPDRKDLRSTGQTTVEVTRLDTFLRAEDIQQVDFLHVDAQGADLAVLRGLGRLARRVRAGVVETAAARDRALYQGQHTIPDIYRWLYTHGFRVTHEERNDQWGNELNVSFVAA